MEEGEGKKPMVVGDPGGLERGGDVGESSDGPSTSGEKGTTNSLPDMYPDKDHLIHKALGAPPTTTTTTTTKKRCVATNKGTFKGHRCLSGFL